MNLELSVTSLNSWEKLTRANEARSWSDGNQTRDSARAEPNSGPLALQAVIPEHPGDSTDRGSEVGDDTGRGCADVRSQGATTVKSEPTEPEEDGSDNNVCGVVGLVGEFLGSITGPPSEVDGDC